MREQLKVVLVGAASPQWGYGMARDLIVQLSRPEICDRGAPILVLEDVDGPQLRAQFELARRIARLAGGRVTIRQTTDQRRALSGARFVVVSFAVGTLEAMAHDVEIPQEYGIYQPVGDTISIGGALRAARNIPALVGIAKDIERSGHPDAWLINIANPMAALCRAVTRETRVRTVGCCHELYGGLQLVCEWLGLPYENWRETVRVSVLGINHCAWMTRLAIGKRDGLAELRRYLRRRGIRGEVRQLYNTRWADLARHNVKINLFLRHGAFPFSGDRHNVEFFTEFVNRSTNLGADYGVLLTSIQERLVAWRGGARARVRRLIEGGEKITLDLSQEAASRIIAAVMTGEPFYDVGNVPYRGGRLPGVPEGTVLERMVTYGPDGFTPDEAEPLPPGPMRHLALHAGILEDVVAASVTGNRKLLIAAMRRDPLLRNMKTSKIPELVGRLLQAHRRFVHPGFF